MTKHAILIAIEEYLDPAIRSVDHAERDLRQLMAAFEILGVPLAHQVCLVNQQATKGVIEAKVRKLIDGMREGDILYFYYVGHGFSLGNHNFLTCHDTQNSDRRVTSISVDELFADLSRSCCGQAILFLDCFPRVPPDIPTAFSSEVLTELVIKLPNCICFTPSRSEQIACSSGKLLQSIWAYHLAEALQGKALLALERGKLTVNSLQNYLKKEVPRTLRSTTSSNDEQTPGLFTTTSDNQVLADLQQVREKRREAQSNQRISDITLVVEATAKIKSLTGWKKGMQTPDRYNDSANQFAAGLAHAELKVDLDGVFGKLKDAFKFTRRDLNAVETLVGTGTITTPFFSYSVTVALDPTNLERVVWTRSVGAIKNSDHIISTAFARVFDDVFNRLEFSLPTDVKVADFVDAVEATEVPDLEIRYDRDCTYCELQLPDCEGTISVTPFNLSIVHSRPKKVKILIESFENVIRLLGGKSMPLNALRATGSHP